MGERIWVVNASPLISLARIDRLDLLKAPEHALEVPDAVANEILVGPASDPARQALAAGFGGEVDKNSWKGLLGGFVSAG